MSEGRNGPWRRRPVAESTVRPDGVVVSAPVLEQKFWGETIPSMGKGRSTSDYAHQDLIGVKDFRVLRLIKLGVTDFGVSDISKMAGDDPVFEGCDLAGLALDIQTARKDCNAWKPVMTRMMGKKFNAKLLALGTNPPQVIWCREKVSGIADMQGKKIRVFNKTLSDFVNALGGSSISARIGPSRDASAIRSGRHFLYRFPLQRRCARN